MAQSSFYWTGTTTGDSGPYSASSFRDVIAAELHAWAHGTDYGNRGPLIDSGNAPDVGLQVQITSPASAAVDVLAGAALVEGGLYLSDATETLAIAANSSGNPRIDTVILRKDDIAQTIRLVVKQGTPAVTPAPPALTQTAGTMWEIPLADVAVANGFVSIAAADLTPRAEWGNAADGVYIRDVLNNSGITLESGDVVIWDVSANRAVTTTTQENHPSPAGVWVGRTNNGDYGRVLAHGVGLVRVNGAYTRGAGLYSATTARRAVAIGATTRQTGNLGFLLETTAGAGTLALAFIDARRNLTEYAEYSYTVAQNTTGPTFASGADRTVPLNLEEYDPGNIGGVSANQVYLQAGIYGVVGRVTVKGPAGSASETRLKIYNATAAALLLTGENLTANVNEEQTLIISGYFALTLASLIELRIRVTTTTQAASALNVAGESEKYATLNFERKN